ncbi:protein-disulfide isomerase [Psychrobium sp. 1_MG-2023]|uniref:protein-disulfide isomerase n=1 Tax=Psychrobium sp. 1_MG-2023 TaxID=3062624 RepID=UPI000C32B3B3|nr:protein-disulfide isomerase [Psychrobium sp. 1_MG-2023]MDP2560646.1 protein-disulfide isomerase [Psychrobium sp. 1_MG-2023]PKF56543.1 protein-disulfide isomerase [Alteromonadales bacterium alter-6D02]
MNPSLYFIYDSHCPWSYACTPLVIQLEQAFPDLQIYAWHCAHYDGRDHLSAKQLSAITDQSTVTFGQSYQAQANQTKDATLSANFLAWIQHKQPNKLLPALTQLQQLHFGSGVEFTQASDFDPIIEQLKLSPSAKIFKDKLNNQAQDTLSDVTELQDFIGTTSFPALLLLTGDKGVLLNHALYLKQPATIIDAVKQELT